MRSLILMKRRTYEFDSSDMDFEAAPATPFSQAGKASIEAIIDNENREPNHVQEVLETVSVQ